MTVGTKEQYNAAKESLERMQNFDASTLPREIGIGSNRLSFSDAVEPARNLIKLYQRLSVSVLEDFPDDILDQIQSQIDFDYNLFEQTLEF